MAKPTPLKPSANDLVDFSVSSTPFSMLFIDLVAVLPKSSNWLVSFFTSFSADDAFTSISIVFLIASLLLVLIL
jgi:hypothetical protein